MLIYEVNLEVDGAVAPEYAEFLRAHIPDVLRAGGFANAHWWERQVEDETSAGEASANESGTVLWTIHYHVDSRERLERYLRDQAPRLRAEALGRFGARFRASRRILAPKSR